ncbi:MAG: HDOD domain-containing protein [Polyangiales bacterium]
MSADEVIDRLAPEVERRTVDLPVLPRNAAEILRVARAADLDFNAVVRLAEADPTLAAKVLSVANSALYARGGAVASVRQATVRLGAFALRDLLLMSVYGAALFDVPRYHDLVEGVFAHSASVASIARRLARRVQVDGDAAYLAGLLHDIGRARCLKIAARALPRGVEVDDLRAAVDALHPRAGAVVVRAWRLPESLAAVCERHHHPDGDPLVRMVHAADLLAHAVRDDARVDPTRLRFALLGADVPADLHADLVAAVRDEERAAEPMRGLRAANSS